MGVYIAAFLITGTNLLLAYLWIIAVCYGLTWTLFIICITNFFNGSRLGEIIALLYIFSPALGSFVLNFVSGALYDQHGTRQMDGTVLCYGEICYKNTYLISFIMNGVGAILCIFLYLLDRRRTNQHSQHVLQ